MWLVLILVGFGCVGCFLGFADLVVGLGGLVLSSFVGCLYRLLVHGLVVLGCAGVVS